MEVHESINDHSAQASSSRIPQSDSEIAKFLQNLPRVNDKEILDEDEHTCLICRVRQGEENPETGFYEYLVKLPCGHVSPIPYLTRLDVRGRRIPH